MQDQVNPEVETHLQQSLARTWDPRLHIGTTIRRALLVADARRIIDFAQANPRFICLEIYNNAINDVAVLNVFCDGLQLCTSITTVDLRYTRLTNAALQRLRPAFYNTIITSLRFTQSNIEGQDGGEAVGLLLAGNNTLEELHLSYNPIFGPRGATGLGQGLAGNNRLQKLKLYGCHIGNIGLANWLQSMGDTIHEALTYLELAYNNIEGADGGRQVGLLLPRFPNLMLLCLDGNPLGTLGAHALALGLEAASHLEDLQMYSCGIGNEGVTSLVPLGQVNRSLIILNLFGNGTQGHAGGENVVALAERCMNLQRLSRDTITLDSDQQRRLDFVLMGGNRLFTAAQALGGQPFPVLFQAMGEAHHHHEFGLSAIFVILLNDGDDYFCSANNREME
jgi:Leucine Rich repeat